MRFPGIGIFLCLISESRNRYFRVGLIIRENEGRRGLFKRKKPKSRLTFAGDSFDATGQSILAKRLKWTMSAPIPRIFLRRKLFYTRI